MAHPLVDLARQTIDDYVKSGRTKQPPEDLVPEMQQQAGVFVSLHGEKGNLRGCIGTIEPTEANVAEEIIRNAISAATSDPRFPPVQPDELDDLKISVDVLSPPEPIDGPAELDVQRYGLIVQSLHSPWKRGLLLPNLPSITTVAQQIEWTRLHKAGIQDPDEPVQMYRFEVKRYH